MNDKPLKISKNLEWLRPFVEASSDYVDLSKIKAIKSYRSSPNKNTLSDGCTIVNGRRFVITIRTHFWDMTDNKSRPEPKGLMLDTLAHELAHIACWEHDWQHFDLQTRLLRKYVRLVKKHDLSLWDD